MDTTDKIFRRYEESRPHLPHAAMRGPSKEIGSLLDLVGDIDAFVFDAFGVLHVGETPIPGSADRVTELRRAGGQIRVLTGKLRQARRDREISAARDRA